MGYLFCSEKIRIALTMVPNKEKYFEAFGKEISDKINIELKTVKGPDLNIRNII